MTQWAPHPQLVVEALASLDTGRTTRACVAGWKGKLPQDPEQASTALWVVVIVARVDACHACRVLGLPACHDCLTLLKAQPVEEDALRATVDLVVETCQAINRARSRSRR